MPRAARIVIDDEKTVYHVMSRTALDGYPFGAVEKDFFVGLIRRLSRLSPNPSIWGLPKKSKKDTDKLYHFFKYLPHIARTLCNNYFFERRPMELIKEIKKIIAEEFAIDEADVVPEAHLRDDLGGDSLGILNLTETVAQRYKIEIVVDEIVEIENVGQLLTLIESKLS